jgi:hypothetical protein
MTMTSAGGLTRYGSGDFYLGGVDDGIDHTWTDYGHPELEGEPVIMTANGPVKVPARPPRPGPRYGSGWAP